MGHFMERDVFNGFVWLLGERQIEPNATCLWVAAAPFRPHPFDGQLVLSRFRAAPSARLGHLLFEGDRALPAQC